MENNVESWMELCELAAKEPDPNRLMKLTEEIVRLLDEKRKPLKISRTLQDGSRAQRPAISSVEIPTTCYGTDACAAWSENI
jgi:hypothetical protein